LKEIDMAEKKVDRRCGTCQHFVFGMRSFCGWEWTSGATTVSTAFRAGGEGHAMWVDDGKRCKTWLADEEMIKRYAQINDNR
jgi:hypothetical protein